MATNKGINARYDFVLLFDVQDGNPNGDPDAGNLPRIDPETGHGLVTDVCLKRKVRNYVTLAKRDGNGNPASGYDIYVKERGILAREQKRAYEAVKKPDEPLEGSDSPNYEARDWMTKNFFDVRCFGAVMTTGKTEEEDGSKRGGKKKLWNCGQVRGPVQLTFARSIDPIVALEHSITRVALTNTSDTDRSSVDPDSGEEKAGSGQMGRKSTIPYGLYRAHGFVSPQLAANTGFAEGDLTLLWQALTGMFESDRSAARGLMSTRHLIVFKHASVLGDAPAHRLFERVVVRRKNTPARQFVDYAVLLDGQPLSASDLQKEVAAR
jgi:CRISPR-associated protein Csd2